MTSVTIGEVVLAPLDELVVILPQIEKAKERARLGDALSKTTNAAKLYAWMPERLENLSTLVAATLADKENLRINLGQALNAVIHMAHSLAGEPSLEDLTSINETSMPQLPLNIDNIERQVEALWRDSIEQALGGQAALGQILSAIPSVESLGRDVTHLAARKNSLSDVTRPAHDRVVERDELVMATSTMADRLLEAGVAPPIAKFLVTVAVSPVQLTDLTEEIFSWIRLNEALALFSISTHRA